MSTILIRRGAGAPVDGTLVAMELGWDTTNNSLYIGDSSGNTRKVLDSFGDNVSISSTGDLSVFGRIYGASSLTIQGNTILSGSTILGGTPNDSFSVNATTSLNSSLTVQNTSTFNNDIYVGSLFSVNSATGFTKTNDLTSNIINASKIITTGILDIGSNITGKGYLDVQGSISAGTNISANGTIIAANFVANNNLNVVNKVTLDHPVITLGYSPILTDNVARGLEIIHGTVDTPLKGFIGINTTNNRFTVKSNSVNTGNNFVGDSSDMDIGELFQPQHLGAFDKLGVEVNASGRWNTVSTWAEQADIYLEETVITVTDVLQLTYLVPYNKNHIQIFVNRLKLRKSEYTATDTTSITIHYPLEMGDEIEFNTARLL